MNKQDNSAMQMLLRTNLKAAMMAGQWLDIHLAQVSGISVRTIEKVLKEQVGVSIGILGCMADSLGVEAFRLLDPEFPKMLEAGKIDVKKSPFDHTKANDFTGNDPAIALLEKTVAQFEGSLVEIKSLNEKVAKIALGLDILCKQQAQT